LTLRTAHTIFTPGIGIIFLLWSGAGVLA